jgi:hypothetical protein
MSLFASTSNIIPYTALDDELTERLVSNSSQLFGAAQSCGQD